MTNTNCLEDMRCPQCGSEGPFRIAVTAEALVTDNGVRETEDTAWTDDSHCTCRECGFGATAGDFHHEPTRPRTFHVSCYRYVTEVYSLAVEASTEDEAREQARRLVSEQDPVAELVEGREQEVEVNYIEEVES